MEPAEDAVHYLPRFDGGLRYAVHIKRLSSLLGIRRLQLYVTPANLSISFVEKSRQRKTYGLGPAVRLSKVASND
jgi:hypothetical protein